MTEIATFSNGFTDTYKGKRDVTVGWAIFLKDTGEVLSSGHSMNAESAEKTARGSEHFGRAACEVTGRDRMWTDYGPYSERAKKRRYNAETRRLGEPLLRIEVVDL